ncbi:uncharacterized protein LOC126742370 [Anthonomus grandis grandis]|uniref:uncharacterized protein LOC126742370 n=1 Tax=Anthonomus grandis grandis TaxID=2921223 RepID=UPI0021653DDD|nr:uncharacterized protein LOC126742370 [Anthonomus grandis grandis]
MEALITTILMLSLLMTNNLELVELKEFSLGDSKICSLSIKRKIKQESFSISEGHINNHIIPWQVPDICKFEAQSFYHKGGVVAVIQKMHLRRNFTTGDCMDYIQFRSKKGFTSERYCGILDARIDMHLDSSDPDFILPQYFPISQRNTFIDEDGELDVVIYIHKEPLEPYEITDFLVVFTSYKDCSSSSINRHLHLSKPCDEDYLPSICINEKFFGDGLINCPHFGCVDEGGCNIPVITQPKDKLRNKVIVGSVSTLGILFACFILLIWIFKKHKLFCWADDFAHPTATAGSNRNSRILEMNEQTGARLADSEQNVSRPTAPTPEEEKDLPPSYDSLFPDPPAR